MNTLFAALLRLARRFPVVTGSLAALALCGAGYLLIARREAAVALEQDANRRRGETMLKAVAEKPLIAEQLAAAKTAVTEIETHLITEGELAANLGYFYQLESASGVRLSQINQLSSQPDSTSPYRVIPFTLRATGSYPQLLRFLRELETQPRLARVRSFVFSPADGAAAHSLTADLRVDLLGRR